ncbi:(d)CMP kinase [Aneurinibacillus soli]|uniref:(d)CMP kinase n=1 Tax=Aneurinibacillus soli TaxID=1500254 RepID=UPI00155F7131|nr:(d)CMP kinase [Aneurinibacillus soli]
MTVKIAIDGPAGAGKSTVARRVAEQLGMLYIDTGAMYRALTYIALRASCPMTDEAALRALLDQMKLVLDVTADGQRVYVNEEDVTDPIRTPDVTGHVSTVAAHPAVREKMTELQREMARARSVVMDGRDIGTHVLPDAELKIFLTASIEERAERRLRELEQRGIAADRGQLMADIAERDRKDSERETAPLKQAEDAQLLDTTGLGIDRVVERIVALYEEQVGERA